MIKALLEMLCAAIFICAYHSACIAMILIGFGWFRSTEFMLYGILLMSVGAWLFFLPYMSAQNDK
jgi:hypothetical protein